MQIQLIKVDSIKPDKTQPRKSFNPTRIKEMAKSILTEGVINPIEVDKNNIIITGEMRWRSAKEAGLDVVPCKILDLQGDERFMRQVVENIHHNTMTDYDTAIALERLLTMWPGHRVRSPVKGENPDRGITWLSEKIGKSRRYITEHFELLKSSEELQTAVKSGMTLSMLRVIKRTPEPFKKQMEKKIVAGDFVSRNQGEAVAQAITNHPDKAKEFLKIDGRRFVDNNDGLLKELKRIAPSYVPDNKLAQTFAVSNEPAQELGKLLILVLRWLNAHPAKSLNRYPLKRVAGNLTIIRGAIDSWLKNEDIETPDIL